MTDDFFRFPHTPHLAWVGDGCLRGDKMLSSGDAEALLASEVIVEEKLDGANLGFSVGPTGALQAQNRGAYLQAPFLGQFARLGSWLVLHEDALLDALGDRLIAFGEWCAARHSLRYDRLPDWWLLFDVYDRQEQRFWNTARRNELARRLSVAVVPKVRCGRLGLKQLEKLLLTDSSHYRVGHMEGIVVRQENMDWLRSRAKLVRWDFTQGLGNHWRDRAIEWNRLSYPMVRTANDASR